MCDCPECGREFETTHGRNVHYGRSHGEVPAELKQENPPTTPRFTEEHRRAISDSQTGENNTMYGRTQEQHPRWTAPEYPRPRTLDVMRTRRAVYERDDYTCQECGDRAGPDAERRHPIHHIDENPKNNDAENMIVLCTSCHVRLHRTGGE